ncbi:MAG: cystathionine beta-lyase [Rhodospirillaceae bacterium]|jgi:cystathionine beta-lyase
MASGKRPQTTIVHAGSHPEQHMGAMNTPVYRASTIAFPSVEAIQDGIKNKFDSVFYGRHGTPSTFSLEEAMAAVEGGHRSVAVPSGLAAIVVSLLTYLKSGDHLLMVDSVYEPTRSFCARLESHYGIETTFYDPLIGAGIKDLIQPNTKVVFTESPGSLTFEVQDLPTISAAAHEQGVKVLLDNTWSGGHFFKPFEHGVDVSIQAATKYIVGHADVMMGLITTASQEDWLEIKTANAAMGYSVGSDDCYLALRGLRTLDVRLQRHQETGLALANYLQDRPEVAKVLHPALPDCPGHEIWQRDFTGSSGLFGVILNDVPQDRVVAMLNGMELFTMGFSWGGFESLMIQTTPARARTATTWEAAGPTLRLHVGQEDVDDLIADLDNGFKRLNGEA